MAYIKKNILLVLVIYCSLFIHPTFGVSQTTEPQVNTKLQQVALFKNGLGFFISEVVCPAKKDSFGFIPAAAPYHGTFWVAYPPEVNLESLIVKKIETQKTMEAITVEELLKANVGKTVLISFDYKGDSTIKGEIKSFAENRQEPTPNPYTPGVETYSDVHRYGPSVYSGRLVMIKTDAGTVAVDPQKISRIDFVEDPPNKTFTRKDKSVRVMVKMVKPAGGKKLLVSYLGKGITWAPSYMIDITDSKKAAVSAKAVVINEVCDIDNVKVHLITGFPHLQFADVISPLAMKEDLSQFLKSLAKGRSRMDTNIMSNVMHQSARFSSRTERSSVMPAYGAAKMGKALEDMFFYPVENVRLSKGETGYLPLFTESVPYTHIYQWTIPNYLDSQERYQNDSKQEEVVWHCLRMENTSKVPWTTAPAEVIKDGLILGQDTLNYTPIEAETTVRITRAIGVKAEQSEFETDRKRDALRSYGYHYDLITIDGKLSVTNFLAKNIKLEITKTLSGEIKASQPEAEIEKLAQGLRRMNGIKKLTWTIELDSGQSKEISYIYEVYVRR